MWAIPVLLALVALVPRLWAPDLVPYGARQAAYLETSARLSAAGPPALLDGATPALAFIEPLLRALPSPVTLWVVVRGTLDAVGVVLLFLAVRELSGVPAAALAGALYATSPVVVAAARDPAGPVSGVLVAAAACAGLAVIRAPNVLRGLIFGALLGLLARAVAPGVLVVGLGAAALALGRASWRVGGAVAVALVAVAGTALFAGLGDLAAGARAAVSLEALRLPGALVVGLAYRPADGWPPGVSAPPAGVAWVLAALVLAGLAGGIVTSVMRARRARPGQLMLPTWGVVLWLAAAVAAGAAPSAAATPGNSGAAVALDPVLLSVLVLAIAGRWPLLRWGGVGVGCLVLAAQVAALLAAGGGIREAAATGGAFATPGRPGVSTATVVSAGSLRDWWALAAATRDVVGRAGVQEFVVLQASPLADRIGWLRALAPGGGRPRIVSAALVLPLARETVYLVSASAAGGNIDEGASGAADDHWPVELRRPASRMAVIADDGVDTGARLVTLRPRPADDWLARVRPIPDGRFADGSALVGVLTEATAPGTLDVTLYWEFPAAANGRNLGERVRLATRGGGGDSLVEQPLISIDDRRPDELTVITARLAVPTTAQPDDALVVWLVDRSGRTIRTAAGSETLDVPLTGEPH